MVIKQLRTHVLLVLAKAAVRAGIQEKDTRSVVPVVELGKLVDNLISS